ncbi:tol-pal system YbgF family protein [Mesorhizobium sp. ANAO-SY3R2]|uniref:tetratricopeptide repeat protein n=1 Tax=Mesorhizobium sp. ANAO-SY3R2 TaxID=3166644 RepID=UPI003671C2CE
MVELIEADDVRLLVELGFIALSAGLNQESERIFAGVTAARPDAEAGFLGQALVQIARNDLDEAISTLRALPPSDAAMTYLGLALARVGDRNEAQRVFKLVVETAPSTPFAALAAAGLKTLEG